MKPARAFMQGIGTVQGRPLLPCNSHRGTFRARQQGRVERRRRRFGQCMEHALLERPEARVAQLRHRDAWAIACLTVCGVGALQLRYPGHAEPCLHSHEAGNVVGLGEPFEAPLSDIRACQCLVRAPCRPRGCPHQRCRRQQSVGMSEAIGRLRPPLASAMAKRVASDSRSMQFRGQPGSVQCFQGAMWSTGAAPASWRRPEHCRLPDSPLPPPGSTLHDMRVRRP